MFEPIDIPEGFKIIKTSSTSFHHYPDDNLIVQCNVYLESSDQSMQKSDVVSYYFKKETNHRKNQYIYSLHIHPQLTHRVTESFIRSDIEILSRNIPVYTAANLAVDEYFHSKRNLP